MKKILHVKIASKPNHQSSRRFRTLNVAASVLVSTTFLTGLINGARAQDTSQGKIKADTNYTYVDSSSKDTIKHFTYITLTNETKKSPGESLAEKLTRWGASLDAKGQEDLLKDNLKMGSSPDAVLAAARNLKLSDAAMQRLKDAAHKLNKKLCDQDSLRCVREAERLTRQGMPLNLRDREIMLNDNLNLVGLPVQAVFLAAKNLGLSDSAMQRLKTTSDNRRDADNMITTIVNTQDIHDAKGQEEVLCSRLADGAKPDVVFLAAKKMGLPDAATKRLQLFLREFYAKKDKRQH